MAIFSGLVEYSKASKGNFLESAGADIRESEIHGKLIGSSIFNRRRERELRLKEPFSQTP